MKITRKLFLVNGLVCTEKDVNAIKRVMPEIAVEEATFVMEMSLDEFMEKAARIEEKES